jgi:hypothetical protein
MNQELIKVLDGVQFDAKAHAAVNYAKARFAIEAVFDGHSAETNRKNRRAAKMTVVEYFGGKIIHEDPPKDSRMKARIRVQFPDNSKAIF